MAPLRSTSPRKWGNATPRGINPCDARRRAPVAPEYPRAQSGDNPHSRAPTRLHKRMSRCCWKYRADVDELLVMAARQRPCACALPARTAAPAWWRQARSPRLPRSRRHVERYVTEPGGRHSFADWWGGCRAPPDSTRARAQPPLLIFGNASPSGARPACPPGTCRGHATVTWPALHPWP